MAAIHTLGMLSTDMNELNINDSGSVKSDESFLKVQGVKRSGPHARYDSIFRRNATHCISPYAIVICVCVYVCLCVCVCVCSVCGPQENGLR